MNQTTGAKSIPIGEGIFLGNVFSHQQWDKINTLIDEISSQPALLEKIAHGKGALENKKFSLSLYKFISRQNGISHLKDSIHTRMLLDIIHHSSLMSQINLLANKSMNILRMQLNIMIEGGYVDCHSDFESDNAYLCSVLIRVGKDYTGGDLIIYDENRTAKHINQHDRTVLVMSSLSLHAVEKVTSGQRYTICLFCG